MDPFFVFVFKSLANTVYLNSSFSYLATTTQVQVLDDCRLHNVVLAQRVTQSLHQRRISATEWLQLVSRSEGSNNYGASVTGLSACPLFSWASLVLQTGHPRL